MGGGAIGSHGEEVGQYSHMGRRSNRVTCKLTCFKHIYTHCNKSRYKVYSHDDVPSQRPTPTNGTPHPPHHQAPSLPHHSCHHHPTVKHIGSHTHLAALPAADACEDAAVTAL